MLLASVVVGILLLAAVYKLPTWWIREHVNESIETIYIETVNDEVYEKWNSSLDGFTDSIMLNMAEYSTGNVFEDVIYSRREIVEGLNSSRQSYCFLYNNPDFSGETEILSYSRYWHGYLVILKPLLIFFNYMQIRQLNFAVQLILIFAVLFLCSKRSMARPYIPAFLILFALQDPYLSSKSLQYSTMFYIYTAAIIFQLLFYEKLSDPKNISFLFLFLGIITAYFDFLTYPLVSYGIPMVIWLFLNKQGQWKQKICRTVSCGFFWIFGYIGMWSGKVIFGSLIVRENLLNDFLRSISGRTSIDGMGEVGGNFQRGTVIASNFKEFAGTMMFPLFAVMLVVLLCICVKALLSGKICREKFLECIPFLIVMVSPVCWLFVLTNHSGIHTYFTFRILFVSAFAMLSMLITLCLDIKTKYKNKTTGPSGSVM